MYKSHYNIAGISIAITAKNKVVDEEDFGLYRVEGQTSDCLYEIDLQETEEFPAPEGPVVFQNEMHMVFDQEAPLHYFRIPFTSRPCEWDLLDGSAKRTLHYLPSAAPYFGNTFAVFNAVGFERILYRFGKYLFHCSYVDHEGRAVLFSAPSGGGKTTQGKLWEQYAGAEMINGDRGVLEIKDGGVLCHGLPIAGSSNVFINRTLPLAAIFVLEKAPENSIRRMKGREAVQAIFSQLTINMWNKDFVRDALDFSIEIASLIPIYKLSCTISQEAVELAKQQL